MKENTRQVNKWAFLWAFLLPLILGTGIYYFFFERLYTPISTYNCVSYEPSALARIGSIEDGKFNLDEVKKDLKLLKTKTGCIRLYKSSGDYTKISLLAGEVGLRISQGIWIEPDLKENQKEIAALLSLLKTNKSIDLVIVGNETQLFNIIPEKTLIDYIKQIRGETKIPITTGEPAYFYIDNPSFTKYVDYIGIQTFPYWQGVSIEDSINFLQELVQNVKKEFPRKKIYILETGWPNMGQVRNDSKTSLMTQRKYFDEVSKWFQKEKIPYNIIEAFDQSWKIEKGEGISGGHWGLWDNKRNDKADKYVQNSKIFLILFLVFSLLINFLAVIWRKGNSLSSFIFYFILNSLSLTVILYTTLALKNSYLLLSAFSWVLFITSNFLLVVIIYIALNEVFLKGTSDLAVSKKDTSLKEKPLPFVSILIPTSNEDPKIVLETIHSCLAQDYPHFEVIVIDNNTTNEELWLPLSKVRDQRYKFFHEEKLAGFKAGALNYALLKRDPGSIYTAFLDADYIVDKNWLSDAIFHLTEDENKNVAAVQYPQAYRKVSGSLLELGATIEQDFFTKVNLPIRSNSNSVLLHGTMSVVKNNVLDRCEIRSSTICEDADLGLQILSLGRTILYSSEILGKGIAPQSYVELKTQRSRWVIGAMQIIKKFLFEKEYSGLTKAQKFSYLKGWLFWVAHVFYPVFIVLSFFGSMSIMLDEMFVLPFELNLISLLTFFVIVTVFISIGVKDLRYSAKQIFGTLLVGASLTLTIAESVMLGFLFRSHSFKRTRSDADKTNEKYYYFSILIILIGEIYFTHRTYGFKYLDTTVWMLAVLALTIPIASTSYFLYKDDKKV